MGMGKIKTEHWSNQLGRDELEATLRISLVKNSIFMYVYEVDRLVSCTFVIRRDETFNYVLRCFVTLGFETCNELPYETPRCVYETVHLVMRCCASL